MAVLRARRETAERKVSKMTYKKSSFKESWLVLKEWLEYEVEWQQDCIERERKNENSGTYIMLRQALKEKVEEVLEQMERIKNRKLPWEK